MITGAGDGVIIFWDESLNPFKKIDLRKENAGILSYSIRSICEDKTGRLLVGTKASEMIELPKGAEDWNVLQIGHFQG